MPVRNSVPSIALLLGLTAAGCMSLDESGEEEEVGQDAAALNGQSGEQLFENATFGGNGRTCETCHSEDADGALSVELVQELFEDDPSGPLFRAIDSDDGLGESYSRILSNATVRIVLPLPPNIRLVDDPTATEVVLHRGVPTFLDVAALDPVLMSDGRAPDVESQALGAINAHFEPTAQPTQKQLEKIANYERKQFSSNALKKLAKNGTVPKLPKGNTASEKRGAAFYQPDGLCGLCHSGPMLNTTSEFNPTVGPGVRFESILAGYPAGLGGEQPEDSPNPIRVWEVDCPPAGESFLCDNPDVAASLGATVENGLFTIAAPDPGVMLITGNPDTVFLFKIPTLWNVKNTAPYFHDNSSENLEEMVQHYDLLFTAFLGVSLSAQDQADIIAFLRLL